MPPLHPPWTGPGSVRLIPAAVLRGAVTVRWRARREAELPRTQPVWLDHSVGQSVWGAQGLACHLLLRTGLSGSTSSRARRFFLFEQVPSSGPQGLTSGADYINDSIAIQ